MPWRQQRWEAWLAAAWRGVGEPHAAEAAARQLLVRLLACEVAHRLGRAPQVRGDVDEWLAAWASQPEAVFWPVTPELVEGWRALNLASARPEWAALTTALRTIDRRVLVAALAALATGASARATAAGAHATPAAVADVLVAWAVRPGVTEVLDPACGAGALLARAAGHPDLAGAERPRCLVGVEADPALAALTRLGLAAVAAGVAAVRAADFLALTVDELPRADAVIANPPFVRSEQLTLRSGRHRALRTVAGLSGRADLSAYFWPALVEHLAPEARAAVIMPASWLEAEFAVASRRFVLDHFAIDAIIEPAAERWFPRAGIHTIMVLARRRAEPGVTSGEHIRLVRLHRPLAALTGRPADDPERWPAVTALVDRLTVAPAGTDWQVRTVPVAHLAPEGPRPRRSRGATSRPPGASHPSPNRVRQGTAPPTAVALPWGAWLRAPRCLLDLLAADPARWCRLGDIAPVRYPLKTGADRFFYLLTADAAVRGIELAYLRPVVRTPRELAGLVVAPDRLRWRVLLVPPEPAAQLLPGVRRYLAEGELLGLAKRPTCAGRRPWYALPALMPAGLLWPRFIYGRHAVWANPEGALENQTLYGIMAAPAQVPVLGALLNSSLGALLMEVCGRVSLGEGALQYAVGQAAAVPVPALVAITARDQAVLAEVFGAAAARVDLEPLGVGGPEREALDDAVLAAVGVTDRQQRADLAAELRAALARLVAERQQRARGARRPARRIA